MRTWFAARFISRPIGLQLNTGHGRYTPPYTQKYIRYSHFTIPNTPSKFAFLITSACHSMCARICLCYCMPNIIWLGIFRNVSHAVNHAAWSRPMQRSVWPHFWVISLCKSLGILSFVTGRDKVRLLLLPVRARLLAWDRLRCHLLNLYVVLQFGKKERRKTRRIQSQPKTMGRQEGQAGGAGRGAKQSSCNPRRQWAMYYISRQLFMRGPKFATKSRRRLIDGLAEE